MLYRGLLIVPQFVYGVDIPQTLSVCPLAPSQRALCVSYVFSLVPGRGLAHSSCSISVGRIETEVSLLQSHPPVPTCSPIFMERSTWNSCSFFGVPLIMPTVTTRQAEGRGTCTPFSTVVHVNTGPLPFTQYSLAQKSLQMRQWNIVVRRVPLESYGPWFILALCAPMQVSSPLCDSVSSSIN